MRRPLRAIAVCCALLAAGCMTRPPDGPLPADLAGSNWRAETVAGEPVPEDVADTQEFAAADRIAGRAGCNRYMGPIGVVDGRLRVGPLAGTRMACPEPQMALERTFLAVLSGATALRRDNSALMIEAADGGPETRLLPFTPP
jgi:heat shock protein HslJ